MPFYIYTEFEIKILSLIEIIEFTRNGLHRYMHTHIHTYMHGNSL